MRDYVELVKALRTCKMSIPCTECPFYSNGDEPSKECATMNVSAADAIEELLAAVHSVVHCKDCRWCHAGYCEKYDDLIPWGCANKPWEDWFCADGKRHETIKEEQDAD